MDTTRVMRVFKLLSIVHSGRALTVEELAAELGVVRRTVQRDITLLRDAGLRLSYDRVRQRYTLSKDSIVPPINFTEQECLAMMFLTHFRCATV